MTPAAYRAEVEAYRRWTSTWPARLRALPPSTSRTDLGATLRDLAARLGAVPSAPSLEALAALRAGLGDLEARLCAVLARLDAFEATGKDWLDPRLAVGRVRADRLRPGHRFLVELLGDVAGAMDRVDAGLREGAVLQAERLETSGLEDAGPSDEDRAWSAQARLVAVSALRHVGVGLVVGADNRRESRFRTGGWAAETVKRLRAVDGDWTRGDDGRWSYARPRKKLPMVDDVEGVRAMAARALEFRAGNCGEHAAVVFDYLRARGRRMRVALLRCINDGDHAFVAIHAPGLPRRRLLSEWPASAILVDGWGGFVCTKGQLDRGRGEHMAFVRHKPLVRGEQGYIRDHDAEVALDVDR